MAPVSAAGRAAALPAAALLGAALAVATVALHQHGWGLALGLAATAASLVALPPGWWSRLTCALAWVLVLGLVAPERPEGDYLVPSNAAGYLLVASGIGVLAGGFVGLGRRTAAPEDSGRAPSPT